MKIRDVFQKDPLSWHMVNEGVSSNNATDLDTLRYELQTFVCEGEYHTGLSRMLQGYLSNNDKDQKAAWVSGFYGSGKSHLVKVLRYLWTDYKFPDGTTARSLATLPQDVSDLLKELSTKGKAGAGLHSAGGTLKSGVGSVRLRLLGIVLKSVDLPEHVSVAKFVMDLRDAGKLDTVQQALVRAKKDPAIAFERLATMKELHEAYLEAFPHHGDVRAVGQALRAQYPLKVDEISIDDMLKVLRRALGRADGLPCTVIVLDEIQQYINNNADVANEVQEVAEACSKELDGRVLLVGTGQSALADTPALSRLLGRFVIKVHLKDNDVEKVVRIVVLRKREDRKKDIEELFAKNAGEVSRQLRESRIASRSDDDLVRVADYPLLPVRRRFWENVLHSIDASGSASQMRTQLRVIHEACCAVADRPLGGIIPADYLYDQLANDLLISGAMQKRFHQIIEEQRAEVDGELRSRICALVFLINKLPREGADIGVRAQAEHLADLLTDDLGASATALREKIPGVAQQLLTAGVLMEVDGEYRLQTTEGAAWEGEFRRRRAALLSNEPQLASQRAQALSRAVQEQLAGLAVLQGDARERRKLGVYQGLEAPSGTDGLVVWVRDGFQESETAVIQDIQKRSVEDATIHVLIPKAKADELKTSVASVLAADETLNCQGNPSSPEGREARLAMVSRQANETEKLKNLVDDVCGGARLFLSGGQELAVPSFLKEAVEDAAGQVLGRVYTKFHVADSPNWPMVWKKAKEGSADALRSVGFNGNPNEHPVAVEVLRFVGAGKRGSEIVAYFTAPPFGWPKDAVDATIATLIVSGHIGARFQGQAVRLADLDQRKIGQADYRVEHPVLTAAQKIRIRQLYQDAGQVFTPGDELSAAPGFIQTLKTIARTAGGDPPAPPPPSSPSVLELEGLSGNDLLFGIHEKADELTKTVQEWKATAAKIAQRQGNFTVAQELTSFAGDLDGASAYAATLEAIKRNRSLLDDPEPSTPVLRDVGNALRAALQQAHSHYATVLREQQTRLEANAVWAALSAEKQAAILRSCGIAPRSAPETGADEALLLALKACDLAGWRTQADALGTRFAQALAAAIVEAEPKARRISLPPATLRTPEELEKWVGEVRQTVLAGLKDGPVIL